MPEISPNKSIQRGRPEMSSVKREEMRLRISEAAKILFHEEGYAKVSMRRIAKEIGCTPMTLYGYFTGKIDILRTLWGDVFNILFGSLNNIPNVGDPQIYLESLCAAYVEYWTNNPEHYRLVFMAEGVTQPDVSLFLENPDIIIHYSIFVEAIQHLGGERYTDGTKLKLDFLMSVMHGIAHNRITISGYEWSSYEGQIQLAIRGIS